MRKPPFLRASEASRERTRVSLRMPLARKPKRQWKASVAGHQARDVVSHGWLWKIVPATST